MDLNAIQIAWRTDTRPPPPPIRDHPISLVGPVMFLWDRPGYYESLSPSLKLRRVALAVLSPEERQRVITAEHTDRTIDWNGTEWIQSNSFRF